MKKTPNKIVFYDGDCGLCNRSVQFILRHEKNHDIHFSTLQSDFTRQFLKEHNLPMPDLSTFLYMEKDTLYTKSTGAFKAAKNLKFPLSALRIFSLLPEWLTDQVYNLVAKYRKRIGGNFCAVPTAGQKKRFI